MLLSLFNKDARDTAYFGASAARDVAELEAEERRHEEYEASHEEFHAAQAQSDAEQAARVRSLIGEDGRAECLHTTLIPHWDNAADMGHADKASSFTCEGCGKTLSPDEARALHTPP